MHRDDIILILLMVISTFLQVSIVILDGIDEREMIRNHTENKIWYKIENQLIIK